MSHGVISFRVASQGSGSPPEGDGSVEKTADEAARRTPGKHYDVCGSLWSIRVSGVNLGVVVKSMCVSMVNGVSGVNLR